MAGGGDTPELVAAVCEAGALGFVGAAYLTPKQIDEVCLAVRARTSRPFGINLFATQDTVAASIDAQKAIDAVAPFYEELGVTPPSTVATPQDSFDQQLDAVLTSGTSAFSFTFGALPPRALRALHERGLFVLGTATTVDEAIMLEQSGVDAVVAQGSEAGGHRGTFRVSFDRGMVGTIALVPQIVDAVSVPVVASGGIMDGRGIAAALALGAAGVQLGTAFLTCTEAGVPAAYKEAILSAAEDGTRLTRAFSGRPARGIVNRFMDTLEAADMPKPILPFPLQNALTRPLRQAAGRAGRAELLSLWAGQGVRLARQQSAADLVCRLKAETEAVITRLARPT
jgi:nitronate monooxygenase